MTVAEAVTLLGAVTAAIVSVMTAIGQLRASSKLSDVHTLVDGQSQRMEVLARAAGVAAGEAGELPVNVQGIPLSE